MERRGLTEMIVRDSWWVVVQVPLLLLAYFLPEWFGTEPGTDLGKIVRLAGAVPLVLGAAIIFLGAVSLGRYLTPYPRPLDNALLKDNGVYALVRHPIYSGIILASAGWSLISLSWPGLAFTALLGLFFDRKAAYEEFWLARKFAAYADYQKRVKKLIPWVY